MLDVLFVLSRKRKCLRLGPSAPPYVSIMLQLSARRICGLYHINKSLQGHGAPCPYSRVSLQIMTCDKIYLHNRKDV